ncbi:MAG TPA: RNA polymerase sigma factor [Miltoncostaea sp.]|nr:RNA polymerase sigma factor [Miltoncostaea sp.]
MEHVDEDARVAAAKAGDADAVAALFASHWRDAWRLARSITGSDAAADDAAQEGFLQAVQSIRSLERVAAFRPWLHRTVARAALDELRRGRRLVPVAEPIDPDDATEDADDGLDAALALLDGTSPERRAAIVLHHCLHYSMAEVAEILDLPMGTVQSRTSRGLSELRAHLGGRGR